MMIIAYDNRMAVAASILHMGMICWQIVVAMRKRYIVAARPKHYAASQTDSRKTRERDKRRCRAKTDDELTSQWIGHQPACVR